LLAVRAINDNWGINASTGSLPAPNSKQAITARKATAARNLGTTGAEIAAAMAAKGRTELEVGADGVAVITICNPPVNSLSIDGMVLRCALYSPKSALLIFPIFLVGWLVRDWSFRSAELLKFVEVRCKIASVMPIIAAAVLNFVLPDLYDPRLGLLGYGFVGNCRIILDYCFVCRIRVFWIGASTWLISSNLSYAL